VALAQLWGDMRALPSQIPRFTHELRQRFEDAGSPPMPDAPADQHDALADARHNLARWRVLTAPKSITSDVLGSARAGHEGRALSTDRLEEDA